MNRLPDLAAGQITVLIDPDAARDDMHRLIALLALRGPVAVLDGGNRFDAFRLARALRRETAHLDDALERVAYARAFTCYQMVALAAGAPPAASPQIVLDLLATFTDESVTTSESARLLTQALFHLRRLAHYAPVIISLRPPAQPARLGLIKQVTRVAQRVLFRPEPAPQPRQPSLF